MKWLLFFTFSVCLGIAVSRSSADVLSQGLPNPATTYDARSDGRSHRILAVAQHSKDGGVLTYILDAVADPKADDPAQFQSDRDLLLVLMDSTGKTRSTFICKLENPFLYLMSRPSWRVFPSNDGFAAILAISTTDDRTHEFWTVDRDGNAKLQTTLKNFEVNDVMFDEDSQTIWAVGGKRLKSIDVKSWKVTDSRLRQDGGEPVTWTGLTQIKGHDWRGIAGFQFDGDKFGNGAGKVVVANIDSNQNILKEVLFEGTLPSILAFGKDSYAIVYNSGSAFEAHWHLRIVDATTLETRSDIRVASTAGLMRRPSMVKGPVAGSLLLVSPTGSGKQAAYQFSLYSDDGKVLREFRSPDPLPHSDIKLAGILGSVAVGRSSADWSKESPKAPSWNGAVFVFSKDAWSKDE